MHPAPPDIVHAAYAELVLTDLAPAPARPYDLLGLVVADVRAAYEYHTALGFGLSETIEDENTLYAAWVFRKPTVHDVAFTGGAGPRLHHLAFFVHESHQVLRICDILGSLRAEAQ